ncbi:MAG: PglZ domain-containing protein [Bacteroidales bacterium]|jgi:DNA-binding response OmpR family regulator
MEQKKVRILWVDDEIELLKPHVLFLEQKGYEVCTDTNGEDALARLQEEIVDLIFLDENMPGLSGLEVLSRMKAVRPEVPVVMITKSEEENIMDEAIGGKIDDYLIKPVNPKQILLAIKKTLDLKRLVSKKAISSYQSDFGKIGQQINQAQTLEDWIAVYKDLVYWTLELEEQEEAGMGDVLQMQYQDANNSFTRFIDKHYRNWFKSDEEAPMLSHDVLGKYVFPKLQESKQLFFIVVDNFRYDHWKAIAPYVSEYARISEEQLYCSMLPTSTQYARNALFAGLTPFEIEKHYPELWSHDEDEGGKNLHEETLLKRHLERLNKEVGYNYEKIILHDQGMRMVDHLNEYLNAPLNVLIFNYIDMLSHSRNEMNMLRDLANDDAAYRSLTVSWFRHSPLNQLLKTLMNKGIRVVLTSDHGSVQVKSPIKVIGDRNTSTNLRYKNGKNLNYPEKQVVAMRKPEQCGLPKTHLTTSYIFAGGNDYLVYPKNYNHFVNYYKDSFQHGGISLEEMLVPLVYLEPIR